jgi:hypothetical protein
MFQDKAIDNFIRIHQDNRRVKNSGTTEPRIRKTLYLKTYRPQ